MPMSNDTKRRKTRYRGISYRERKDGTRTYSIYWRGNYTAVEGGENEALAKQAELRGKAARGEQVVVPTKLTFAVVAEEWFAPKRHLRAWTSRNYRAALDRILIRRFGSRRVASITAEDVAALIRDLERQSLVPSTIANYLKPLSGAMAHAASSHAVREPDPEGED